MSSARQITSQIIIDSFSSLKNLQRITQKYIVFNPYLVQNKKHPLYPLISYNHLVKKDIESFGHLLVKNKLGPPLLNCQPLQNIFVSASSYIKSAESLQITYFHEKWLKASEDFNSSLRELNEHELQEKQLRENLIRSRNNIENTLKEMKQKSQYDFKQNQTLSRVLSYIL